MFPRRLFRTPLSSPLCQSLARSLLSVPYLPCSVARSFTAYTFISPVWLVSREVIARVFSIPSAQHRVWNAAGHSRCVRNSPAHSDFNFSTLFLLYSPSLVLLHTIENGLGQGPLSPNYMQSWTIYRIISNYFPDLNGSFCFGGLKEKAVVLSRETDWFWKIHWDTVWTVVALSAQPTPWVLTRTIKS